MSTTKPRPAGPPARKQLAVTRQLGRERSRAVRKALRKAARRDAPVWLRFLSAFRLVALLLLITLTLTASVWLVVAYFVSIFTKAIRT